MKQPPGGLYSIAKIALMTFVGSFFGALIFTGLPTTLAQAKMIVMPALGTAVANEVYYLRTEFAKALAAAGQPLAMVPPGQGVTPQTVQVPSPFGGMQQVQVPPQMQPSAAQPLGPSASVPVAQTGYVSNVALPQKPPGT